MRHEGKLEEWTGKIISWVINKQNERKVVVFSKKSNKTFYLSSLPLTYSTISYYKIYKKLKKIKIAATAALSQKSSPARWRSSVSASIYEHVFRASISPPNSGPA